jgi:hypothetical protein
METIVRKQKSMDVDCMAILGKAGINAEKPKRSSINAEKPKRSRYKCRETKKKQV